MICQQGMCFHPFVHRAVQRSATFVSGLLILLLVIGCNRTTDSTPGTDRPGDEDRAVIGVSLLNLSSEFIVMLDQAMREKANELGVRLIVNDAQRSAEKQVQQVESFIAQQVDTIILNPCEVEASSPAVEMALATGIPVVNVNSETRAQPTAFVGSRDEESARLAMQFIADQLGGKGNVAMMHGFMGQAAQIKREQGALAVVGQYPDLRITLDQTAEWDRAKAMTLMENWITSNGDSIDAVFAQNDEMGMGALIALEQADLKDRILVVSVDAISDALQAVKAGRLDATVFQDAKGQGGTAVEMALKLARGEKVESELFIPFQLVTRENVDQFLR